VGGLSNAVPEARFASREADPPLEEVISGVERDLEEVRWVCGKRRTSELEEAIMVAEDTPVPETLMELELGHLDRVEIRREWLWIDILLLDERPGTSGRKSRVGLAVLQRAAWVRRGEAGVHPRLV
jgi:hypothetical protein